MKKIISLFIISFLFLGINGKDDGEKVYRKLLKFAEKTITEAPNRSGYYRIEKKTNHSTFRTFYDYYQRNKENSPIDVIECCYTLNGCIRVEFFHKEQMVNHCLEVLNMPEIESTQLKVGSAYFPKAGLLHEDRILWNGEIVDGKLHGKGVGLIIHPSVFNGYGLNWDCIKGMFNNGYPIGEHLLLSYSEKDGTWRKTREVECTVSDFQGDSAVIHYKKSPLEFYFKHNGEGGLTSESRWHLHHMMVKSDWHYKKDGVWLDYINDEIIYDSPENITIGTNKLKLVDFYNKKNPLKEIMERCDNNEFCGYIQDINLAGKIFINIYRNKRIPDQFYAYYLMSDEIAPEEKLEIARKMFVDTITTEEEIRDASFRWGERTLMKPKEEKEIIKEIATAIVPIDSEGKQTVNIQDLVYDACKKCGKYADYVAIYKTEEGVDKEALQKEITEAREKMQAEEYAFLMQNTPAQLMDKYGYDPEKDIKEYGLTGDLHFLNMDDLVKYIGRQGSKYPFNDLHPKKWYTLSDFEDLWRTTYFTTLPTKLENWYKKHEVPRLEISAVRVWRKGGLGSSLAMMLGGDALPYYFQGYALPINVGQVYENDMRILLNGIALAERITPNFLSLLEYEENLYWGVEENRLIERNDISNKDSYRDFLRKAIDVAQKKAETEDHPEYYLAAAKFIKERLDTVIKVTEDLRPLWEEVQSNRADRMKARRSVQCDNCKIDGEKTIFPKGWKDGFSSFFLSKPGESEEAGVIVFKNGLQIKWKYTEDNDGKIRVKNLQNETLYDRVDDMVNEMINYCKKVYCE